MKQISFLFAIAVIFGFCSCRPYDPTKCLPPPPPPISGPKFVNVGSTIKLSVHDVGGTWSTGNAGNATVGSTGVVRGVATGTANITYTTKDGGCGAGRAFYTVTVTAITLAVGESFAGGVIAYILQPGDPGYDAAETHGLIAAPTDQVTARWGSTNPSGNITNAAGVAIGTGQANTDAIIAALGTSGDYAANICRELTLGGQTGWYLPSRDELNKLYENRAAIGSFGTGRYWSSTEFDSSGAWSMFFDVGAMEREHKGVYCIVRAVRSF